MTAINERFRYPMLVVMMVIFLTHLAEIIIFTVAFWVMTMTGIGSLAGAHSSTPADFFYFSIASYTTLGMGDIAPEGAVRIVAGLEALTGLLLIAWSASFTYLTMESVWAPEKD
ncbi:ion channel [Parasphingorhabdus sp.]